MGGFFPVQLDLVGAQNDRQPSNNGSGNNGVTLVDMVGIVGVGANLYIPMGPPLFNGVCEVWKSTDNGATWSTPDQVHAPVCRNWSAFFNKATGKIVIAFLANNNVGAVTPILLAQYDTATDTYSTIAAPAPRSTMATLTVVQRSNGDIVVFHVDNSGANALYWYSIWNGAAWTNVQFDLTGTAQTQSISACIDSTDRIHFVYSFSAGVAYNVLYRNLDHLNVLTGTTIFPWVTATGFNQQSCPRLDVSDAQDCLYMANLKPATSDVRIFFALPRSAPVWNSVLNGNSIGILPNGGGTIPYTTVGNDGNLYIAVTNGIPAQFVYMFNTPANPNPIAPWTMNQVMDQANCTPAQTSFPTSPKIYTSSPPKLAFNGSVAGSGITRFILGVPAPPPPPAPFVPGPIIPQPIPLPDPCCNTILESYQDPWDFSSVEEMRIPDDAGV